MDRNELLLADWYRRTVQHMTPQTRDVNRQSLEARLKLEVWDDGEPVTERELADMRECLAILAQRDGTVEQIETPAGLLAAYRVHYNGELIGWVRFSYPGFSRRIQWISPTPLGQVSGWAYMFREPEGEGWKWHVGGPFASQVDAASKLITERTSMDAQGNDTSIPTGDRG